MMMMRERHARAPLTQLTAHPGRGLLSAVLPRRPLLVFERDNVRDAQPLGGVALWTIDLKTGKERRITPWWVRAGDTPDWAPDGSRILFHSNNHRKRTASRPTSTRSGPTAAACNS